MAGCGTLSVPGTPETATSLNGFRASHGLSQLRTDGTLAALAGEHAADMARRDTSTTTASSTHRARAAHAPRTSPMAARKPPASSSGWVKSSGHRTNMLIPSLTRYGLASATSPSGKNTGRCWWAISGCLHRRTFGFCPLRRDPLRRAALRAPGAELVGLVEQALRRAPWRACRSCRTRRSCRTCAAS